MSKQRISSFLHLESSALFVAAPFLLFPNSITPLALALLAAPWLVRWRRSGHLTRRTALDWPLALLAIMALVGAYTSPDLAVAWPKLLGILLGLASFYAVVNSSSNPRQFWGWLVILLLLGFGFTLIGALGADWFESKIFNLGGLYRFLPRLPESLRLRLQGGDFHPNEIAGMVVLFLPLTVALCWGAWRCHETAWPAPARTWQRLLLTLIAVMQAIVLLLTQSRSAILGLALTAAVAAVVWQRRLLVLAPLFLAGLVWYLRSSGAWLLALPGADPANLIGRLDIWQRALTAIADFPLTGVGLGAFRYLAIAYAPFFTVDPVLADVGHAHNIFLQTALDMGIPGLIAYSALLLLCAAGGWQLYRRATTMTGRTISGGLLASLLAFHLFSLTDAVAPGARPIFTLWLLFGLLIALMPGALFDDLQAKDPKI